MAPVLEGKLMGLDPKKTVLKGELLIWPKKFGLIFPPKNSKFT
jgi:hypothetical protein